MQGVTKTTGTLVAAAAALLLSAGVAGAVPIPVQFLQFGDLMSPTGFSPTNFPMPPDMEIPLTGDVRPVQLGPVVDGFGISLTNCAIMNETPAAGCVTDQPPQSLGFTLVVDITLVSVPDAAMGQDSLIFLSAIAPTPTYELDEISVIVDADPINGIPFTPFTTASVSVSPSVTYYYLGFMLGLGDSATFRIDVTGNHSTAGVLLPIAANGWVVPEPSTALLVGTGLLVLARRRNR